jgi:hypothetical protein
MCKEMPYSIETRELTGIVGDYPEFELIKVNGTSAEKIWNQIMQDYHYLGYSKTIGRRTKYLIILFNRVVGGISFNQATLHLEVRDAVIGWDTSQKKDYLKHVVNNNRFLIMPNIRIKNLASHILSKATKTMLKDWKEQYGDEIFAAETFVGSEKNGICYLASNWSYLGETKGYSKQGKELIYHGNKKKVFFRILNRRFPNNIHPSITPKLDKMGVLRMQLQGMGFDPHILENANLTVETVPLITEKLISYLSRFMQFFFQLSQCNKFAAFIKGVYSPLERKSLEPIALNFIKGKNGPRLLQHFFSDAKWDDQGMSESYQDDMLNEVCGPDGMLTVDEVGFPKKGKESVGVDRQYCGPLGKTENCQTSVMIGYYGEKGYGLLVTELYLPQK